MKSIIISGKQGTGRILIAKGISAKFGATVEFLTSDWS